MPHLWIGLAVPLSATASPSSNATMSSNVSVVNVNVNVAHDATFWEGSSAAIQARCHLPGRLAILATTPVIAGIAGVVAMSSMPRIAVIAGDS